MLLHACHNSVLLLAALMADKLTTLGWNVEQDHAPLLWVVGAVLGAAAGGLLIGLSPRTRTAA
jgi:hypothetical protein